MARKTIRTRSQHGAGTVARREAPDGTVRFQARWTEPDAAGQPHRRAKTFDDEASALAFLQTRDRRRQQAAPATMTVTDLIAETLDRARGRLSERTILTYRTRAERMIAPTIGARRLIDLTTLDVQRWIDQLGRAGYAPATIHAAVAVLYGALRDAAIFGLIDRNIAAGIRRPGIEAIRATAWTLEETRRFLAIVRDDELYGALYHLAITTGLRPGELRALPWADVDLDRKRLLVRHTMSKDAQGREVIVQRTKTRRDRAVALADPVVELLRWHRAQQLLRRLRSPNWHDRDLVFDRGDGHWLGQNTWRQAQARFCDQAGVPVIRAHDLRHTSASLDIGIISDKITADRLGHRSTRTTQDIYQHVDPELHREAMETIAAALFGDDSSSVNYDNTDADDADSGAK